MSTTIDERVVEMRFDNRHFEQNVSTTMSTLDKLKQKLNLSGASKGLEGINTAAKNVNMTGLGNAVETVTAKFSALQVMGVTALANITNSAVNAGKRIVSALTIDPVKSGLSEYETKMGSIQTILANTQHQGTTMDDVTAALEELNLYADKTIYNFQEMTRNIGTFTAAGVDLETSVKSIQGIANLAAVSGSTSQQASTAMYQLSQALATGTVKLMDWNSVVNAGMGGKVFQNALIQTAAMLDGASDDVAAWQKENIDSYGSFRDSLTQGSWLTSEVLTQTLKQFTMAAEEGTEEWEAYKKSLMETGYTEAQAVEILKMANTATDAATKVKTFTQLFDTLKESAQSGWAQTWELIFGDFEEAKEFFTGLSDMLGGLINSMSEYRNNLLGEALDSNWDKLITKINEAGHKTGEYEEAIRDVWKAHGNTDEQLDSLITKYGTLENAVKKGAISTDILKEALAKLGIGTSTSSEKIAGFVEEIRNIERVLGFGSVGDDVKSLQTALEELGYSVGECKIDGIIGKDTTAAIREFQKEAGIAVDGIAGPETLAALEKAGKSFEDVVENVDDADASYDELIDNITDKGGRQLFLESFSNVINGLVGTFRALGSAWADIFPASDAQSGLFSALETFNKLTQTLRLFEEEVNENGETVIKFTEKGEKLVRIFKGVFAVLDIITTILGGGFKIAFKIASQFLSYFNLDILDVVAGVGDALVGFRDFIDGLLDIGGVIEKIAPYIEQAAKAVQEWFESLKTSENLPADIISGLINGLISGVGMVWDAAVALAKSIVDAIKSFLGIHSPSTVMYDIGTNTVEGLNNGIAAAAGGLLNVIQIIVEKIVNAFKKIWVFLTTDREYIDWDKIFDTGIFADVSGVLKTLVDKIIDTLSSLWDFITDESGDIDWGKIFSGGMLISMVWFLKQIATAISGIADAFGGLGDVLEGAEKVMKSFSKVLNGYAWDLKAQALQKMAIAIGILVLAIVVLTEVDDISKLWNAVGIIAALAIILGVLAFAMDKLCSTTVDFDGKKIEGLKSGLLQIGLVIILLAAAVKLIGDMDPTKAKQGFLGLTGMAVGLILFLAIMGKISQYSKDASQIGGMMLKLSLAMILMVGVIKLIGGLDAGEIFGGIIFAAAFAIFVRSITKVAKSSGNNVSKVGGMMIKLAIAMGLMVGVVKLVSMLSVGEMFKGAAFATGFVFFVRSLVNCTKIGKKQQLAGIGGLVMSVSFSLMLMVGVCKLVGMLSFGEMIKGAIFVIGFMIMLKSLVSILSIGSEQKMAKVSGTILAMAIAIAILAAVSVALSFVDPGGLAKGIIAVGALGFIMSSMVKALKGANEVKGSIMMMAIAIGIMAAAIVALTFIDDTSKLAAAAGSLALVMAMFALIAKCSNNIDKAAGTLIIMTFAVAVLAGILWMLTNNIENTDSAIKVAASLGILMLALAASLKMLDSVKSISSSAIGAMAGMVIILIGLTGIFAILNTFNIETSIESAISLSILLLAMSGAALILSKIGPAASAGIGGAAAFLGLVAGAGAILAVLGGLIAKIPGAQDFLDNGIPIIEKVGQALGSLIGGIIGGIGEGIMNSFSNMVDTLGAAMAKLVVISTIGAAVKTDGFDGIKKLLEVIGDIALTTVGTSISDIFTLGGTSMEKFQTDGEAFFKAMKAISEASAGVTVDEAAMDAVIRVAQKLADLQSSLEPIDGVLQFFTGRDDLSTFGNDISEFITSMKTALSALDGFQFDNQTLDEIIAAATSLAGLQASLEPIDGVLQFFTGRDDLSTFGDDISEFITSMKTALATLDGATLDEAALASVISATKDLADLQESLESVGGFMDWLNGREDLGTFGEKIGLFADAMGKLKTAMGEDGMSETVIASITSAGDAIIALQTALPEESWFDGKMNLSEFSDYVSDFGTAMGDFAKTASDMDSAAVSTAISAAYRIKNLIEGLVGLDTSGLAEFTGVGTGGLGADGAAYKIAQAMSQYSDEVTDIDTSAVSTSVSAATDLKSLISSLVGLDTSGISNFKVEDIGSAIDAYSDKVSDVDFESISSSITASNRLIGLINSMASIDSSGVSSFKTAISSLAKTNIDEFVSTFKKVTPSVLSAGSELVKFLIRGIRTEQPSLVSAVDHLMNTATTALRNKYVLFQVAGIESISKFINGVSASRTRATFTIRAVISGMLSASLEYYSLFYSAGSYLVSGFANGISANSYKAAAKSAAMARAAINAAKAELREHSPSKVFYDIGSYAGEGFVNAFGDYETTAFNAGSRIAKSATNGLSKAISKIGDAINSDIDSQPVIRPVLDLSEVQAGAGAIGSMFGTGTIGLSNLGTISTMMNRRSQNGGNSEVVSAIDKLRKELGNVGSTSYNINGVTYNRGSELDDAVRTIVRYAKIEGRT